MKQQTNTGAKYTRHALIPAPDGFVPRCGEALPVVLPVAAGSRLCALSHRFGMGRGLVPAGDGLVPDPQPLRHHEATSR
jgi:hypothetical protein